MVVRTYISPERRIGLLSPSGGFPLHTTQPSCAGCRAGLAFPACRLQPRQLRWMENNAAKMRNGLVGTTFPMLGGMVTAL